MEAFIMTTKKEAIKQAQELANKSKPTIKEVKNKFSLRQKVISNVGVPAYIVSIFLTPETASSNGAKIKEPILYQVRDAEGPNANVDRTLIESAIFLTEREYKAARIKDLKEELADLEK